jgi:hypothetical protein
MISLAGIKSAPTSRVFTGAGHQSTIGMVSVKATLPMPPKPEAAALTPQMIAMKALIAQGKAPSEAMIEIERQTHTPKEPKAVDRVHNGLRNGKAAAKKAEASQRKERAMIFLTPEPQTALKISKQAGEPMQAALRSLAVSGKINAIIPPGHHAAAKYMLKP